MLFNTTPAWAKKCRERGSIAVLREGGSSNNAPKLVGAIRVSGLDATSFLHSQLTNEVKLLKPGDGNLSARVTRLGTLLNYFSVHRIPGEPATFLLLIDEGVEIDEEIKTLLADLGKFAIVEDVVLEDISTQYDWIVIHGPRAAEAGNACFGHVSTPDSSTSQPWHELSEYSIRFPLGALPLGSLIIARSLTGDPGFVIAVPREENAPRKIVEEFRRSDLGKGFIELPNALEEVLNLMRIEAGIVRMGVDAEPGKIVLPETGLEQYVVSYSKGCYLGQEVIARIRTYGSVPLVLRGLVFKTDAVMRDAILFDAFGDSPLVANESAVQISEEVKNRLWEVVKVRQNFLRLVVPQLDAELLLEDGRKVGRMASSTLSPMLEAPIAFAYLDRAHRTPGTKLKIRGNNGAALEAEVRLLPFYRAADTASRVAFLHDRAIRLFSQGDDAQAQALLEEALRLDPGFADGYEALGVLLGRREKFAEAIDIFKRLEEVAPNEPMVHTNLSLFYMKLGDKVAAEEEKAKAIVKQFSKFAGAKKAEQFAAEELAKKRADAERKRAMFEEVLEIDPEDPIALFGLGNALSAMEDWEGAERVLAKSCAVQSDNSAAYLARGKALEMLSRETDAVAVYREGMAVASKKGDLMPLKEMERRVLLLAK